MKICWEKYVIKNESKLYVLCCLHILLFSDFSIAIVRAELLILYMF